MYITEQFHTKYLFIPVIYLIIDTIWIYNTSTPVYAPMVEGIQKSPMVPRFGYAFGSYAFLVLAILLICMPLKKYHTQINKMPTIAAILFSYGITGLIIYAVYNFTNAAIFKAYPLHVLLIDSLWGLIVFSLIGFIDSKLK